MHSDFQPIRHLATGGMAELVLARHLPSNRLSALKILRVRSADMRRRILQEGRFQRTLRHPNLVPVLDVFDLEDGTPVLEMPYVNGPDLDLLVAHHRFTLEQADQMGRAILRGVQAIHDVGLVHRDLKPENILIGTDPCGPIPMVTDFGLAKLIQEALGGTGTRTGVVMGTPGHMAPEQFRDAKRADARADVFALGTILYELVCGERCFPQEGLLDSHTAALQGDYMPLAELAPALPMRMRYAIERAMLPEPEDRPQDAGELLMLWADGMPEPRRPWRNEDVESLMSLHLAEGNELPPSLTLSHFAPPPETLSRVLLPDNPSLVTRIQTLFQSVWKRIHPTTPRSQ